MAGPRPQVPAVNRPFVAKFLTLAASAAAALYTRRSAIRLVRVQVM